MTLSAGGWTKRYQYLQWVHCGIRTESRKRGDRCLTCKYKDGCEFYWDITKNEFSSVFIKTEAITGYIRTNNIS